MQAAHRFTADTRAKLLRLLGVRVVDVQLVVGLLEAQAGSYLLLRPVDGETARELRGQRAALGKAVDVISKGLTNRGYTPEHVTQFKLAAQLLDEMADEDLPPGKGGRRPELVRAWLARNIRMTLEEHGVDIQSRVGARALSQCLRLILASVGEMVPYDLGPLLNKARRP